MFKFKITERGATPRIAQRAMNNIVRGMFRVMGIYWHSNFRAKHFTQRGAREYGYGERQKRGGVVWDPRTAQFVFVPGFRFSYQGKKLRRFGHTRPLVYTGESEQRSRRRDVRATATKTRASAKVRLHAPNLNFRRRGSKTDPPAEMRKITDAEGKQILRAGRRFQESQFRALARKRIRSR